MAYNFTAPQSIGATPIGTIDDAARHVLGTILPASDPVLGGGEFIYLKGVAGTAVGTLVDYDLLAGTTTITPATGGTGPVAVATAATVANKFGWYQIAGVATIAAPNAMVVGADCYMLAATPGSVDDAVVANEGILSMKALSTTGVPSAGLARVSMNRPTHGITTP
jgi:hypothetical protein